MANENLTPLTEEQQALVGSHFEMALKIARKQFPLARLRTPYWVGNDALHELLENACVDALVCSARSFDQSQGQFGCYAKQAMLWRMENKVHRQKPLPVVPLESLTAAEEGFSEREDQGEMPLIGLSLAAESTRARRLEDECCDTLAAKEFLIEAKRALSNKPKHLRRLDNVLRGVSLEEERGDKQCSIQAIHGGRVGMRRLLKKRCRWLPEGVSR